MPSMTDDKKADRGLLGRPHEQSSPRLGRQRYRAQLAGPCNFDVADAQKNTGGLAVSWLAKSCTATTPLRLGQILDPPASPTLASRSHGFWTPWASSRSGATLIARFPRLRAREELSDEHLRLRKGWNDG